MPYYVKKPVVVEARQYTGQRDFPRGVCFCGRPEPAHVHEASGVVLVNVGDWVVRSSAGYDVVSRDAFAATYERADGRPITLLPVDHPGCADPACCACGCRECGGAWEQLGRPLPVSCFRHGAPSSRRPHEACQ